MASQFVSLDLIKRIRRKLEGRGLDKVVSINIHLESTDIVAVEIAICEEAI